MINLFSDGKSDTRLWNESVPQGQADDALQYEARIRGVLCKRIGIYCQKSCLDSYRWDHPDFLTAWVNSRSSESIFATHDSGEVQSTGKSPHDPTKVSDGLSKPLRDLVHDR